MQTAFLTMSYGLKILKPLPPNLNYLRGYNVAYFPLLIIVGKLPTLNIC